MSKGTILAITIFLVIIGAGVYLLAQYAKASQERKLKEQQLAGLRSFQQPTTGLGALFESLGGFI